MTLIQLETPPDVSFVIPTFNKVRYTAQCMASIAQTCAGLRYEIIVVDNGSTDETISFVRSHTRGQLEGKAQGEHAPERVVLAFNNKQRALSRSWNMGIENARGRHIIVSNNDVIYAPGAIAAMVAAMDSQPHAGVVIPMGPQDIQGSQLPTVAPPDTPLLSASNIESVKLWEEKRTKKGYVGYVDDPYLPQGSFVFLTTKAVLARVGFFDEDFELTGEDWDWLSRLRRHFKIVRAHDAYVEHYEHTSCLDLADEYHERLCRSRFLLAEKREGVQHLFSIVMPVHNRVDSLQAAIDSVLRQSFPHWRLYVIDDGSSDWDHISALARKRYANESGRIWFFHRKERKGPGAARNYGLSQTSGKYVAFLDSDDVWYPDHLARHFHAHENGGWAGVYSTPDFAWRWWDEEAKTFLHIPDKHPTIQYFGPYDKERLTKHCYIQTSSFSAWGELARSLKFPETQWVEEDYEYFKAIADAGGAGRPMLHLQEKTCRYHIARQPHEEDHLIRRALPGLGNDTPFDVRKEVLVPLPVRPEEDGPLRLGVVIPTRDRPDPLLRALDSVGASVPVVVVDDASENKGAAILRVAGRPNGCLLRLAVNKGQSAARNKGVAYIGAEWIQFLDDDDTFVPDWEKLLLPHLSDDCDIVLSQAWVPDRMDVSPIRGPAAPVTRFNLVASSEVFTSQVCVRRSRFLDAGGFLETLSWGEEREMIERMTAQGARVKRIAVPLVMRVRRGGSGDPASGRGLIQRDGIGGAFRVTRSHQGGF